MYTETPENSISLKTSAPGPVRKRDCRDAARLEQDPSWRTPISRVVRNHRERVVIAALSQVAVQFDCEDELRAIIASYDKLDPKVIQALGADHYPVVLREVRL